MSATTALEARIYDLESKLEASEAKVAAARVEELEWVLTRTWGTTAGIEQDVEERIAALQQSNK
jgi:uncharacterized coiled-coil protein SlyX